MKRMLVLLSAVLAALAGVAGVSSAAFGATKPALSIAVSPMAATANSTGNALTFKVTASSSVSGQLSLVVPAGWTAPQASNPALPGYVVVQKLTCASAGPSPTSITGSGPWTMYINFSCATNKSFSLTYGNVTAPAATGSYQFTSSVGGQLLSTQPVVKVNPAPVHLSVTGLPATAAAGTADSFTVTALNSNNNAVTGYTGTVHFTSTDGQAVLPANYTFTAADAGKHTFTPGVTFKTAGSQTLTATDTANSSITGTSSAVTVAAPPTATHFSVTAQSATATAGTADTFTVKALDSSGNTVTGYTGTVQFSSTDGQAVLPQNYTFTAADAGVHTFTAGVTFKTAGSQTVTATDTVTSSITGTSSAVTVAAAAATQFVITGLPSTPAAGAASTFTVTAEDSSGNVVTGYTGIVDVTSSDHQAVLPASYTFTAADAGKHTFTVTFKTAGLQTLMVTDITVTVRGSADVTVAAGPAASLVVSGLASPSAAGAAQQVTVAAQDAYGNTATGYAGTVQFSSTDGQAVLPQNYTFTAADAGTHAFTVTLNTAGQQTVTATDTVTSSVTGTSPQVTVTALPATHLIANPLSTAPAGTALSLFVTAQDANHQLATGYAGTVHFTSSDPRAVLPADYTFTAADAGQHEFTIVFKTAGLQTLTMTDTVNSSLAYFDESQVTAGPAAALVVSGLGSPSAAGAAQSVTVTAQDAFGNIAAGYAGTVHFTSTDASATLPGDYTFTPADAGSHTFSPGVTFSTAGQQTVTATDTVTSSVTGTSPQVTVTPTVTQFNIQLPPTSATGALISFTVTALDVNDQVVPGYTGTVHFSSSDPLAVLPADYTFTAADAGQHTFTLGVAFNTLGYQSLTVTDASNPSVTGTSPPVIVSPGAGGPHFEITGLPPTSPAGALNSFTVTALDVNNQVMTGYTGTVHFASDDPQAFLPGDYTFTAADHGSHTFTPGVAFYSGGLPQILSVIDTSNSSMSGSASVGVGSCAFGGTLFIHSNGLTDGVGQTFTDCVPVGTYNQTQATEAALAWLGPGANSPQVVQVLNCPGNDEVVVTTVPGPGGQFAAWDFTGSNAGRVVEFPPGPPVCPGPGDNPWY